MLKSDKQSKVAFLVPYFGAWPKWSELFFKSCAGNDQITILLACEKAPPYNLPTNVRVSCMTKVEVISRLEKVTGLSLEHVSGHKLCDFRPFFGLAFSDLLQDFDFWGFCDIDIMFGDTGKLLTQDLLESVDVFTADAIQCAGHFTILRNNSLLNNLAYEIPDWKALCREPLTRLVEERLFPLVLASKSDIRIARPLPLEDELEKPFASIGITFDFQGKVAYSKNKTASAVQWKTGEFFIKLPRKGNRDFVCSFYGAKTLVALVALSWRCGRC